MNNEELVIKVTEHDEKIKVANNRIRDLEEQQKQIQELTISVKELAISVKNMVDEQSSQREEQRRQADKIEEIENRPEKEIASTWNGLKDKLLFLVIGGIVGYIFYTATGITL